MYYKISFRKNILSGSFKYENASEEDITAAVVEVYKEAVSLGLVDPKDKIKACQKIRDFLNRTKTLSTGSYIIADLDSLNDFTIPNGYGSDTKIIFAKEY